ncbi:hypothetical protein [Lentzea xinjiangensis]|nr:hypothetical protein [Lentzea xinjiangensis]
MEIETLVELGDPAGMVVEASGSAAVVVVGPTGPSRLDRFSAGSITAPV